ncbi:MAG: TonB family protein [Pseudomonadota bacterium]
MNSMIRYAVTVLLATTVTLGLFYLMHHLIDQDLLEPSPVLPVVSIQFGPVDFPEPPPPRTPEKAPEKEETPEPPAIPTISPITPVSAEPMQIDRSPQGTPSPYRQGTVRAPSLASVNQDAGPENPRPPIYPPTAAQQGIEGWVRVEVVVDARGRVRSTRVLESQPRGVFDSAALAAISGWSWRPKIVDGRAVEQTLVQEMTFSLED